MVLAENTLMRPRPQDFVDYRAYLREMFDYLKVTRPQFSYRYFSRIAGFTSPNFLKLVADGERNLTPPSIPKFAKGLWLDEHERDRVHRDAVDDPPGHHVGSPHPGDRRTVVGRPRHGHLQATLPDPLEPPQRGPRSSAQQRHRVTEGGGHGPLLPRPLVGREGEDARVDP